MIWAALLYLVIAYESLERMASRMIFGRSYQLKDHRRRQTEWPRAAWLLKGAIDDH